MPILSPEAPPPLPSSTKDARPIKCDNIQSQSTIPPNANFEANRELEINDDRICRFPTVRLDVDAVTDLLAARLATSLLGHILFLKSQVPFPVTQLSRIPSGKSNARVTKLRTDLLQSFDTLSSHLNTTFTALSTALARCSQNKNKPDNGKSTFNTERAYLAILVGPSMGSARSKVIYAIDGLETKIWGTRNDTSDLEDNEGDEELPEDSDSQEDSSDEGGDPSEGSGSEEYETEDELNDDPPTPPRSRSPSPPPPNAYFEEQKALNVADRLLSRTLAAAEAEGQGMANEMAPTQIHILIRAPRRFDHPAWIPRQGISASLDDTLNEFLEDSGFHIRDEHVKRKKTQKGKVLEGVWITCRDGLTKSTPKMDGPEDEESETIWWSWDGKIVGFSDW